MKGLRRRQLWADSLLLLVTLIWGGTFVMVKDAVASYPVFPFLTLRFGLATCALVLVGWRRLAELDWRQVGAGVLLGLFLFAGYVFQTVGLRYTSASNAGFITGFSVVLVPLFSAVLLHRPPALKSLLGVSFALVGLGLLTLSHFRRAFRGDFLVLLCALSFALHIITVSAFAPHMDPLTLTIVQMVTVTAISAAVAFVRHPSFWRLRAPWFAASFTGILATAAAFAIQTTMQRFTTPTHTALIFSAEPVFAALLSVLLTEDVMKGQDVAGGILIVLGTMVSEIRWSDAVARWVSRFLAPHYVTALLLVMIALADPLSLGRGLLWAGALNLLTVVGPLVVFKRELRRGAISDWHISDRRERLQFMPAFALILAIGIPLFLLLLFDGPRPFLVLFSSALALTLVEMLVTVWWKISGHVSTVALEATIATAFLGAWASPLLLLIPLVAWARVKVGAHTVMQTLIGGLAGVAASLLSLHLYSIL
ncbi:MAG: EamA family transporter [Chloroflexota bacterium]|nr:EamA family transporter [Chloroflexota bacterium]